jgi:hypothetical protein
VSSPVPSARQQGIGYSQLDVGIVGAHPNPVGLPLRILRDDGVGQLLGCLEKQSDSD